MNSLINLIRSLSHLLAAFTSNCAHFQRAWQGDGAERDGAERVGRWQGEWVSSANGHRGQLRCVLTGLETQDTRACFYATYARLLRVCYCVPLAVERSADQFHLQGETDLGKLAGGIYRYQGELTDQEFLLTYRCRYDHGTFRLHRVAHQSN